MEDRTNEKKDCLRRSGVLLAQRDYTCRRLKEKLLSAGFKEEIVEETLQDLKAARYLDDARYAENFVNAHREDRSRMRMRSDLETRGVPPEVISEVLSRDSEEHGNGAEIRQIRRLMRKRGFDPASAGREERNKIQAFLYRKGYNTSSIRAAMRAEPLDSDGFSV